MISCGSTLAVEVLFDYGFGGGCDAKRVLLLVCKGDFGGGKRVIVDAQAVWRRWWCALFAVHLDATVRFSSIIWWVGSIIQWLLIYWVCSIMLQ